MGIIIEIWDALLLQPMLNALVFLYGVLASNFGLSIIAFTIAVRIAMYPLTRKQLNASRSMSRLQPKIQEIRQKHGKDSQKVTQETMKLYKEEGVNPIGCLGPMFVQLPIWIGLYQSIIQAMPRNPERLVDLSQKLYSWLPGVHSAIPLNKGFLWFDLSEPDPTKVMLPLLVGGSMWVQQKMMATVSTDPKQMQMNRMMQWMMPVMFGMITIGFPSGLALYWVVSNTIGIALQYRAAGWGNLLPSADTPSQPADARSAKAADSSKEMVVHGEPGSVGKDSGGGNRPGPETARGRSRRGRRRRRNRG